MKLPKRETDVLPADCLTFFESLASKFVKKSRLKFVVVRNTKRLNPEIICMTPEKGTKFFKSLVDNLVQLD